LTGGHARHAAGANIKLIAFGAVLGPQVAIALVGVTEDPEAYSTCLGDILWSGVLAQASVITDTLRRQQHKLTYIVQSGILMTVSAARRSDAGDPIGLHNALISRIA
jgi:hypothetical protein